MSAVHPTSDIFKYNSCSTPRVASANPNQRKRTLNFDEDGDRPNGPTREAKKSKTSEKKEEDQDRGEVLDLFLAQSDHFREEELKIFETIPNPSTPLVDGEPSKKNTEETPGRDESEGSEVISSIEKRNSESSSDADSNQSVFYNNDQNQNLVLGVPDNNNSSIDRIDPVLNRSSEMVNYLSNESKESVEGSRLGIFACHRDLHICHECDSFEIQGKPHCSAYVKTANQYLITDIQNDCIHLFEASVYAGKWAATTRFFHPRYIVYSDKDDAVFVMDRKCIYKFDSLGRFIQQGFSTRTENLRGLDIVEESEVILVTSENSPMNGQRVIFIDLTKEIVLREIKLSSNLSINGPDLTKFLYLRMSRDRSRIVISDIGHKMILMINEQTGKVRKVKTGGKPAGVSFDNQGNVLVGNLDDSCIEVFDREGFYVQSFKLANLTTPCDIRLNERDELFVADLREEKMFKYTFN